jgi:23S rRNA pseudouridine1911/1915/1917 synthase
MLDVLYEDAHLLVVAKPAGVPTQGLAGAVPTLESAVRQYLRPDDPSAGYVGTVHRLDRPVTGVILWAKTSKAARRVADQFARREARKEYWAVVEGMPASGDGTWEDWLCVEDTGVGIVQVCSPAAPRSRHARTRFRVEKAGLPVAGFSWIRLWPETGRRHQLRVQASARGLPIVGDRPYGSTKPFLDGIALHARRLTIVHPILEQSMLFEAPLPDTWLSYGLPSEA